MTRPNMPAHWQSAIYRKHAHWIAGHHVHFAVGDGWADVVSRLFDRLAAAVALEPVPTKISIVDVKEKYGSLVADFLTPVGPEAEAAIDRAVMLAEMRSEVTCDVCGERGKLRSTMGMSGWLAVRCDDHRSGYPRVVGKGPPRREVRDRRGAFEVRYDRDTDTVVETPINDEDSR